MMNSLHVLMITTQGNEQRNAKRSMAHTKHEDEQQVKKRIDRELKITYDVSMYFSHLFLVCQSLDHSHNTHTHF